jgi:3-mercaptopyruvate sulfurtransferase SseA
MKKILSSCAAMLMLVVGLYANGAGETTNAAIGKTEITPMEEIPGPLVTSGWLKAHLKSKNLVVIEIHSGETKIKYNDEHIPGSVFASSVYFQKNLPSETNIPYDIPSKDEFETLARSLGINTDSKIVIVYPGFVPKDVMCATRTFWTFDYYGISSVSILDGGLGAWKRAGYAVDNVPVVPQAGNFIVASENHANYATLDQVIEYSGKAGTVLLDSRMVSDYIGTTKQDFIPESGHITYCNSGQFSTTSWFALKEIAGMNEVSSFDGSVSEWVNKGKLPLIKG